MRAFLKYAVGAPIFMVGWYYFFVSAHLMLNSEASLWRVGMGGGFGLIAVFVGGYIMMPILAEQIADKVIEHITDIRNVLPGGRRKTDPPAPLPNQENGQ